MKLIFLDIDGVLNHDDFYRRKFDEGFKTVGHDDDICPVSVGFLNRLTDETGAKIVLSSTWRLGLSVPEIQTKFDTWNITGELWGKTRHLNYDKSYLNDLGSVERGKEIAYWLETKLNYKHTAWCKTTHLEYIQESGLEQYIILDDDTDMLYNQRNHFVHIPQFPVHSGGLDQTIFEQALSILNKTIEQINY